jgi:hypothetical protein
VGGGEGGGGKVHCAESMYFYSVHSNTHEKGEASHKSPNVQKLLFFVFLFCTFCDVTFCNCLRCVLFTFFDVYVLCTVRFVTLYVL